MATMISVNGVASLLPVAERKPESAAVGNSAGASFGDVLNQALQQVEQDQVQAKEMATKLVSGQVQDVAQVMIASERANLSLGIAVQVRNKVLEAYQEIMRMPL